MAITFVGSANGSGRTVTYTSTAGNLLVLMARLHNGTDGWNPTGDSNNTWVGVIDHADGTFFHRLWYAANCFGGVNSFLAPNSSDWHWVILEYAGVALTTPSDQTTGTFTAGSGTTNSTGSITPTLNGELVVAMSVNDAYDSQTESIGSGLSIRDNSLGNLYAADIIQTTKAAVNPTWTDSTQAITSWYAGIVSFESSAPPNPAPTSVSPTSDKQGYTGNVTVSGTAFDAGGTSTIAFSGTGVTVNSYGTRNATTITANITITSGAALTARDIVVTNADAATGTLAASFTVTVGPPLPTSVSPTSDEQGYTGNVTVAGTNFSTDTPFSQTIVRDTFVRTNSGTLGANWTTQTDAVDTGTIGITTDAASPQASGGNSASYYNAAVFQPNQYAECIVTGSGPGGPNTHGGGPATRMSSGNYYRMFVNMNNTPAVTQFQKLVAGTFTGVGNGTSQGGVGSLARLESIGSVHTGFVDGVQVFQFTDTDLATGAVGIDAYYGASTTIAIKSWEGGDLLWARRGVVIPTIGGGSEEPSVLYEANPQILTANGDGKIFKMWFMNGWTTTTIYYAESNDGITWTEYGSNPAISDGANNPGHGSVIHVGSTYYGYYITDINTNLTISRWTSSNGVTWTKTGVVLSGGVWDVTIFNPVVWVQSGTWYMMYEGVASVTYSVGLATSTDGITWTKYVSNPVMTSAGSTDAGKTAPILIGDTYYYIAHGSPSSNLPSDIYLWSSPDLHTWTPCPKNPIYERVLANEGVNLPLAGQVADPCLLEVNGTSYLFYDATAVQNSGHFVIKLATAPYTIPRLLQGIFGNSIVTPATLAFSGAGVTVNSYSVQNDIAITANISITAGAALTARNVTVTNADATTGTLAASFTITLNPPSPASIAPTGDKQGYTGNVTVTGTNFSTGTLSFSGTGITVNSYSVQNSTTITANITIGLTAATTARDVVVTNSDAQTATLAAAFTVALGIYSEPDSRTIATYPTTPNASRNVEGTLTYDVQTSDNADEPGVDSRTAGAPVDSRTNKPTNSRTPGTYGPGE